jgi:acyl-CoA synthetase (NDP forming)
MEGLIEALKLLHVLGPLEGGRIGAMSTSGGDLIMLADAMGSGLTLPPLSGQVAKALKDTVHERVSAANPLDYQMFDWDDEDRKAATFSAFMSEGFDLTLCILDYAREDRCDPSSWGGAERGFIRAAKETGAKGAMLATFSDTLLESAAERYIAGGVAPLAGIHTGLAGVRAAVEIGAAWKLPKNRPLLSNRGIAPDGGAKVLNEAESKERLARIGVPVPKARIADSPAAAAIAADELGYPVALKALGVAHKTEVGGVRLNLAGPEEVSAAVNQMSELAGSFLIEKMVQGVVAELIVGVARDEQFGPYLVVGGGGILVEMMRDSASLLLPISKQQVLDTLSGLNARPC